MSALPTNIAEFLSTVFHSLDPAREELFLCHRGSSINPDGWRPTTLDLLELKLQKKISGGSYLCTSTLKPGTNQRKIANVHALHLIVLDDVGTKVPPNELSPTYIIETSQGNFQWGYALEVPIPDVALAQQVILTIYGAEALTDSGGAQITKLVRLPFGTNAKVTEDADGNRTINEFPVTLIKWEPQLRYHWEDLLAHWSLVLQEFPQRFRARRNKPPAGNLVPLGRCIDPVLDYLYAYNKVLADKGGPFVKIECPRGQLHTNGDHSAMYSPLGRDEGEFAESRQFKCFHEHCKSYRTDNFLEWIADNSGPNVMRDDPLPLLQDRYILASKPRRIYDSYAPPGTPAFTVDAFRDHYATLFPVDKKGKSLKPLAEQFMQGKNTQRVHEPAYRPDIPDLIFTDKKSLYVNTYARPEHPKVSGEPTILIAHLKHLIPNEAELENFIDLIAYKLQNPSKRTYSVVFVAQPAFGEKGHTYGTGRGALLDLITKLFQHGVVTADFKDLISNEGQSEFNDWMADVQIVFVEEAKQLGINPWSEATTAYERVKQLVDPRVRMLMVKGKRKDAVTRALWFTAIIFSNHRNCLALPADDRRFFVIDGTTSRPPEAHMQAVEKALEDPSEAEAAKGYHWLMSRDMSAFKPWDPPMTPAKEFMIAASKSSTEELIEAVVNILPGAIVTQDQLHDAATEVCTQFRWNTADQKSKRTRPCAAFGSSSTSSTRATPTVAAFGSTSPQTTTPFAALPESSRTSRNGRISTQAGHRAGPNAISNARRIRTSSTQPRIGPRFTPLRSPNLSTVRRRNPRKGKSREFSEKADFRSSGENWLTTTHH